MVWLVVLGIFIGIVSWMVISSNWNALQQRAVADTDEALTTSVALGSDDPIEPELVGLESLSKAFTQVSKKVSPAVVPINSEAVVSRRVHPFFDDEFFRRFFNFPEQEQKEILRGLGSGVIVNSDGYILTNNHVIDEADEIYVTLDREKNMD